MEQTQVKYAPISSDPGQYNKLSVTYNQRVLVRGPKLIPDTNEWSGGFVWYYIGQPVKEHYKDPVPPTMTKRAWDADYDRHIHGPFLPLGK